jgi:hypothetical protein
MHIIQDILMANEMDCYSYSGRCMYGKKCLGVTVKDIMKVFAALIESSDEDNKSEIAHCVERARRDSMGYDTVVYFPNITYDDSADENEDDDDDEEDE